MCWLLCRGWLLQQPTLPAHPLALCLVSLEDHLLRMVTTNPVVPRLADKQALPQGRHQVLFQA